MYNRFKTHALLVGMAAMAAMGCDEAGVDSNKVDVGFESSPPGVTVISGGEELGVTPVTVSLEPSTTHQTFEFHLDGHQRATKKILLSEDGEVTVQLKRESGRTAKATRAPKKTVKKKKNRNRRARKSGAKSRVAKASKKAKQQGATVRLTVRNQGSKAGDGASEDGGLLSGLFGLF